MTSLARRTALAAVLAGATANPAGATTEDGFLMFAEGVQEGEKVRMIAGEVDGRGLLYAEYYTGPALRYAVPYTRVFVDGEPTNVRALRELRLAPRMTTDGFAFTALQGATQLSCTALVWSDATVSCSRNTGWVPPGSRGCSAAFQGHDHRSQCNGLQQYFAAPAIGHDELLRVCTTSFRWESYRENCVRYGYNQPAIFEDTRQACTAAYRTEHERDFCMFSAFAPVEPKERVTAAMVRECDRLFDDDKQTALCGFRVLTGGRADKPEPPAKPRKAAALPTDGPTAPVALAVAPVAQVSGATLDVSAGTFHELTLRGTGGMIGTEPVLFVDAFTTAGELKWSQNVDRFQLGKQVRALRELTKLDRVKLTGDVLTFRGVHAGKTITCRADAALSFAVCR